MDIVEEIYSLTKSFPKEEMYGLTSQLRRAAVSVPANIAEGNGRETTRDYLRFLSITIGSLCEVETLLQVGLRLGYVNRPKIEKLIDILAEEGRMLRGLQKSLRLRLQNDK